MNLPLLRDSMERFGIRSKSKSPQPPKTNPLKPLLCCAIIAAVVLSQIFLVVHLTRPRPKSTSPRSNFRDSDPQECPSGSVYVYDLPAIFNKDLFTGCGKLDPLKSKCDAVSNGGYGPTATTELSRVVPEKLSPAMYWTDHYMGEIIYHERMLDYKCRTSQPESATAFYIPFYAGLAAGGNHTARDWDLLCKGMLEWIRGQQWWKRSNGSDHFIMIGRPTRDSRFINIPGLENVLRLSVERSLLDHMEMAVPYPTVFHPRSVPDVREWQKFVRSRARTSLFAFVGATSGTIKDDFREILTSQCRNESDSCRRVEGTTAATLEAFLGSVFCLQPKGEESVFDCMLAGSIPVFFGEGTAYGQYEKGWFLPGEPESYSVFIDQKEVRNGVSVRKVLQGYHIEEVWRMRERAVENIPKFLYGRPSDGSKGGEFRDAFDIAIDGVLMKFKDRKVQGN